jgi:hypothetical protein
MKKIFTLLLCSVLYNASSAQLIANAGADAAWCNPVLGLPTPTGPHLGGHPTATGGTPPYTYSWFGFNGLYPFQYLDTDTVANPQLISWVFGLHHVDFELVVTDANGQTARDTVRTYASSFTQNLYKCVIPKYAGDTVTLTPFIDGGSSAYAPVKYLWTPAQYISSDTAKFPLCWSPVDKYYMVYATDSVGCTDTPKEGPCYVVVLNNIQKNKWETELKIYPNPVSEYLYIEGDEKTLASLTSLAIYDVEGRSIKAEFKHRPGKIELNTSFLSSGTYLLLYYQDIRRKTHLFAKE